MMVLLSIFEVLRTFYDCVTLMTESQFSKNHWDNGAKYLLYAPGWELAAGIFAKVHFRRARTSSARFHHPLVGMFLRS